MSNRILLIVLVALCLGSVSASRNVADCAQHNSEGDCLVCQQPFLLSDDGLCELPQLSSMDSYVQARLLMPDGTCYTQDCVINCLYCDSSNTTKCNQCQSQFKLIDNACVCSGSSNCTSCNVDNCDNCSTTNICKDCFYPYQLVTLDEQAGTTFCMSCSVDNCTYCRSSNVCVQCETEFSVSTKGTCIKCTALNCAICQDNGGCAACATGYIFAGLTSTCVTCNVIGCKSCSSNDTCSACQNGYLFDSGNTPVCIVCTAPCGSCNTDGSCATCLWPQWSSAPSSNGTCYQCQVQFCKTCSSSSPENCTTCMSGYTAATNGTCLYSCNETGCSSCNSNGICTTCSDYYYLNGSSCVLCTDAPYCKECNSTTCKVCNVGYYMNSNMSCIACPNWCLTCSSSTVCLYPKNSLGITLFNGGTEAAMCETGCSSCSQWNPQICYTCLIGYTVITGGICQPCAYPCATCSLTSASMCMSCVNGAIYNSQNNTCTLCNSTCDACLSSSANTCTACNFLDFVNSDGGCSDCGDFCQTCTNSTNCTMCRNGFAVNSTGGCLPCLTGCQQCSGLDTLVCLSCGPGFMMMVANNSGVPKGTCNVCPYACNTCGMVGDTTYCAICRTGYTLSQKYTCQVTCTAPCLTCQPGKPTDCKSCFAGYQYSSTSMSCSPITKVCDSGSTTNSSSIVASSVSGVCALGYSLIKGICVKCAGNCGSCENITDICLGCYPGSYLTTNNTCVDCPSGCYSCVNSYSCQTCKSGWTLVGQPTDSPSICYACTSPCKTCYNSTSQCTSCVTSFSPQGWACLTTYHLSVATKLDTNFTAFFAGQYSDYLQTLMNATGSSSLLDVPTTSLSSGSILTGGSISVNENDAVAVNNAFNGLKSVLAEGNSIGGIPIIESDVTSSTGVLPSLDSGVNLTLILAITIPIAVILIIAIGILIYCRYKKSSNVIEKKIQEDGGLTVRETFELSNDMTGRKIEAI